MDAYDATLASEFAGRAADLTEENLQARIRGNLLMALSNKFGWLVLTTGNKSEMSVGYTTLYGDLAGGFAVIKDVPKTLVYRPVRVAQLARRRRRRARARAARRAPIPASIIERAPSAELRPDQRDEDSLPPYELLDRILHGYVELDHGREQLIAEGLPAAEVDARSGWSTSPSTSAARRRPGIKITDARVRPRPAHADHQPLPRLSVDAPALAPRRAPACRSALAARRALRARARRPAATRCRTSRSPTTRSRA